MKVCQFQSFYGKIHNAYEYWTEERTQSLFVFQHIEGVWNNMHSNAMEKINWIYAPEWGHLHPFKSPIRIYRQRLLYINRWRLSVSMHMYTLCIHASAQLSVDKYFVHFTLQLPVKGNFPRKCKSLTGSRHQARDRIQK